MEINETVITHYNIMTTVRTHVSKPFPTAKYLEITFTVDEENETNNIVLKLKPKTFIAFAEKVSNLLISIDEDAAISALGIESVD